jgi:hypothetical protein
MFVTQSLEDVREDTGDTATVVPAEGTVIRWR